MDPKKDYINSALAEYINENPQEALKDIKVHKRHRSSQQWRLGQNGPLKRLGRSGPLRPVWHHMNKRSTDGLPRLVLKRYKYLPGDSVFHRLGWNPLYAIARHRVQQAKDYLWRSQFNYRPRGRIGPMGRRPMYQNWQHPHWRRPHWRRPMWGRPYWQRRPMHPRPANNLNNQEYLNQQMIKSERLRIQNLKLRKLQNFYQPEDQPVQHPARLNSFMPQRPNLPDASTSQQYRIARDDYLPPRNVRAPSPEGSIISALSRPFTNSNPFARPPSQPAVNPFAPRGSATQGIANAAFNASFRPTPSTTIPFSQRFSNNMAMAAE